MFSSQPSHYTYLIISTTSRRFYNSSRAKCRLALDVVAIWCGITTAPRLRHPVMTTARSATCSPLDLDHRKLFNTPLIGRKKGLVLFVIKKLELQQYSILIGTAIEFQNKIVRHIQSVFISLLCIFRYKIHYYVRN